MRSGSLDREITLQTFASTGKDQHGTPIEGWSTFAVVRAQLVQSNTEEYLRGYGEGAASVRIFRVRWLAGVTLSHRVIFEGTTLNVREVKEIGRHVGLELRCEEVRDAGT